MGFVAGGSGTLGDFVMKALKTDAGVRYWGGKASVTGAVGLLDRVAPLCFAAPVFFHSVRWYFGCLARHEPRMRILGIDPGLRTTGFGVIDVEGRDAALRRQRHDQDRRGRTSATCRRG